MAFRPTAYCIGALSFARLLQILPRVSTAIKRYHQHTLTVALLTTISVLLVVGPKCTMAASHAASW